MFKVSKLNRRKKYRSDWLKTVKRDKSILGFKCEKCGSTDRVERHHIIQLNGRGGADNLLNLMILCYNCHLKIHRKLRRK